MKPDFASWKNTGNVTKLSLIFSNFKMQINKKNCISVHDYTTVIQKITGGCVLRVLRELNKNSCIGFIILYFLLT